MSQTFMFQYSDSSGYTSLDMVYAYIGNGGQANSCYVYYQVSNNTLVLLNDAATGSSAAHPGTATTLQNSQCSINIANSAASGSGTTLSLQLAVSFSSSYAGSQGLWLQANDTAGTTTNWNRLGSWTVGSSPQPPMVVSVTPSSGSGMSQSFAFQYSDSSGYTSLDTVYAYIGNGGQANSCYVYYQVSNNTLVLLNDAATGSSTAHPGTATTLQNSQCSINVANSAASGSGTTLSLQLAVTFSSSYAGSQGLWLQANNTAGSTTSWNRLGSWTVGSSPQPPMVVSVTPSSGSGMSQSFAFQYSDSSGYTSLDTVYAYIGNGGQANSCYVYYQVSNNTLVLLNDAATGSSTAHPGTATTLQNSQCSINVANSAASGSGTTLSLQLAVTFSSSYAGSQGLWLQANNTAGSTTSWNRLGSWTVGSSGGIPTAINHVIFMLQENRTFDNYFGMLNPYRRANGWNIGDDGNEYDVDGLDGSKANISNPMDENTNPNDTTTTFTPFKFATTCTDDMSSAWLESYGDVNRYNFLTSRAMQMNGFVHNAENEAKNDGFGDTRGKRAMGYFDQGFLNYYYFMASQFAVSDRWFSPVASKTIPNRLATMTGGTTQGLVYDPSLDDGLINQLNIETIFQELDQSGVSWKIYYTDTDTKDPFPATTFGDFTYSDNYMHGGTCNPPTTNVNGACIDTSHIAPLSQYFTDVQNGTLPQFAYIEPGYNDGTDEHPTADVTVGQQHMANIINTFMNSASWHDSVFFLSYDEGGGPFDHVPPVPGQSNLNTDSSLANITPDVSGIAVNPDGFNPCPSPVVNGKEQPTTHCDLRNHGTYQDPGYNSGDAAAQQGFAAQLGFRLPNLVISPFTRRHYVSHIPMDHTAIIKFVENRFIGSGAHLTNRDTAQPNLLDFFDFNAVPWASPPSPPTPASGHCSPEDF